MTTRIDQPLIDSQGGLYTHDMLLRLRVFGPFGNRRFVDRMTTEKKLAERNRKR